MINNKQNIDADIISRLLVATRVLEKAGDVILSPFGITMGMYELLVLMADQVDTTTRMANLSQITLASITHKTKLLEEKGYISRVLSNKDKRVWYFSLTSRGQSLLETIREVYDEITRNLFVQFSESDKQLVLALLTTTEAHLRHVPQNRALVIEHINKLIEQKGLEVKL
jgi:MarR family transcriptional regulator, 2-MHQ and catechol-resistance regulon repressor